MKIDRFEAHDRLLDLKKKGNSIDECCQDLINQRPFGNHPFYIFAHARTHEDGSNKRLIWQPRLTKPKAQTNSMLFKAYPGTDVVKIIWMIPERVLWSQYGKGKVTENELVSWSIDQFRNNRAFLEKKEDDDLSDEAIDQIYRDIGIQGKRKKAMEKLYAV
jgi:hypothetical protein